MSDQNRPLVSTEDDMPENKSGGGCLGRVAQWIGIIVVICFIISGIRSCGEGDETRSADETPQATPTNEVTTVEERSPEALSLENLLFHCPYTDLGTVQIHHFPERGEALEWLATYCSDKELFSSGRPVQLADPLFGEDYYYCTISETNLYYIGEIKDDRPDGFGAVVGLATGSGTYDFKGEALFYCVGNFKEGMLDGYGISFAADEADITHAVQDVVQIMGDDGIDDDVGGALLQYLFDYVSYEGYWKEGKKDGKGNAFGFSWDTGSWYGDEIRFVEELNPPLDGYLFGPAYPNVTMGEYENGELNGQVNIYKYNHLVYSGEMKNGQRSGYGVSYYNNGQVEYDGEWKNDAANGMGAYYDQEGALIYTGEWEDGNYGH